MAMSGWLDVLGRDLKFTRHLLGKNRAFTITAVATLALGIAASTVIYSVVDAVLLEPLDYQGSGDIYRVYTVDNVGLARGTTGPPHIDPIAEEGQSIESAFYGYSFEQSVVNGEGTAFALNEFRHSMEFFKVFTEPMHLGRSFEPGDNYQDTVLSYQTWRDVFGSDPNIIGRPINVGSGPLTVIGVAAEGFEFPIGTGMWTLIFTAQDAGQTRPFNLFNMPGYVRAVPGVSAAQVQAELDVFADRLGPWPGPDQRRLEFVAQPLLHEVVGELRGTLLIVSGATAVLLLIACINVANLLLARGVVRTNEFALREAIGARRSRVFGQLMTESAVLCTLGGVLGLGLALGAIQLLKAIGPADLPRLSSVSIDVNVVLFALGCVVLVAVLVGFAPALRVARGDLSALINAGGRSASLARGRNRIFGALVIAEIALAVVLVIGAGLLVRSYSQLATADPGFDPRRMLTLVLNVTGRTDIRNMRPDQERQRIVYDGSGLLGVAQFYEELTRRIDELPGVAAAGVTSAAPLNQGLFPVVLGAFPVIGSSIPVTDHLAYVSQVSPEYFRTLDIRPIAGRLLEANDRRGRSGVVVINESYARAYLSGENPIGRRIALPGAARPGGLAFNQLGEQTLDDGEIVGVIPDIKQATLEANVQPALFVPQAQWHVRKMAVIVRAENDDPASLIPAIRGELESMDSTLPGVFAVYSDVVASSLARHRLGALLLVVFALVSLILAAVGTYGLMSFSVNQRFNEIAVRSAFGAERGRLLEMFVKRALRLAALGILLGVAGAIAMRQFVASQLYETSALDPWVLVLVPLTMLAVTLAASYMPARRAARIDVSSALREN